MAAYLLRRRNCPVYDKRLGMLLSEIMICRCIICMELDVAFGIMHLSLFYN